LVNKWRSAYSKSQQWGSSLDTSYEVVDEDKRHEVDSKDANVEEVKKGTADVHSNDAAATNDDGEADSNHSDAEEVNNDIGSNDAVEANDDGETTNDLMRDVDNGEIIDDDDNKEDTNTNNANQRIRRSGRSRNPPPRLQDYIVVFEM
jgi:cobalamin biosynthesis protein CobT